LHIAEETVLGNENYTIIRKQRRVPRKTMSDEHKNETAIEIQKKLIKDYKIESDKVENVKTKNCIEKIKNEVTNLDSKLSKKYVYMNKALKEGNSRIDIKGRIKQELEKFHSNFAIIG
jgi:hypothetical protein